MCRVPPDSLMCKKPADPVDAAPCVVGVYTLLKQSHSDNTNVFLAFLGQYVRSLVEVMPQTKDTSVISQDVLNALMFLEDFIFYGGLQRKVVESFVPTYIFDEFRAQFAQ